MRSAAAKFDELVMQIRSREIEDKVALFCCIANRASSHNHCNYRRANRKRLDNVDICARRKNGRLTVDNRWLRCRERKFEILC